jgi:DNA-directed RNA polymerase subunit beta
MVSIATAMIPFLENDDANRALMGANMQRQAVPLLVPEAPTVATGMEHKACIDSEVAVLAEEAGEITHVSSDEVTIRYDKRGLESHKLIKFLRSNHGTCINQRPIVTAGQRVKAKEVIADGPSTCQGEISLGRDVLVGFMTWEGYTTRTPSSSTSAWCATISSPPCTSRNTRSRRGTPSSGRKRSPATSPTWARTR